MPLIARNRNFLLLWSGQVISQLGNNFNYVALAWLVLTLTGSVMKMSALLIAQLLPNALFGLFFGVLVDRLERRRLMILCDVLRAVLVVSLPLLFLLNSLPLWYIYINVFVVSSLSLLFSAAEKTLIPLMVEAGELTEANAFQEMTSHLASLIGPAAAGFLIALLPSSVYVLYIDSATFAVSALTILLVSLRAPMTLNPEAVTARTLLGEAGESFLFIKHQPLMLIILLTAMLVNFSIYPVFVVLPLYSLKILKAGSGAFGLLLGALGGGMLAGSLAASWISRRLSMETIIYGGMVIVGGTLLGLSAASDLRLAMVFPVIMGFVIAPGNAVVLSLVQLRTPEALLGRVMTMILALSSLAGPLGVGFATHVMEVWGPLKTLQIMGLLVIASALAGLTFFRRYKKDLRPA